MAIQDSLEYKRLIENSGDGIFTYFRAQLFISISYPSQKKVPVPFISGTVDTFYLKKKCQFPLF
jgi:hypothetical protein